jgi:hypothetical protein
MRILTRFLFALLLLFAAAPSVAGGSLSFQEVERILEADPVGQWLLANLEFVRTAAGVRLGNHWEHLSGARQGPYTVDAITRDGSKPVFVTIETNITYYAGEKELWSGEATHGSIPNEKFTEIVKKADSKTETFRGVHIKARKDGRPLTPADL